MEKRFFKKVGNWLFIIAVLIVSVNSALKGNFEGYFNKGYLQEQAESRREE